MADTEPEENVEIRFQPIQDLGLDDRVAGRLGHTDHDLLFVLHPKTLFLGYPPCLAQHACDLEALSREYLVCDPGLLGQPNTEGKPQLLDTDLLGELADLLDSRLAAVQDKGLSIPVEVALALLNRGESGKLPDLRFLVLLPCFLDQVLETEGRTGIWPLSGLEEAGLFQDVDAANRTLRVLWFSHELSPPQGFCFRHGCPSDSSQPIAKKPLCQAYFLLDRRILEPL